MTKTFVLRPNALLSSDHSTQNFGNDNIIVIPLTVLDEINKWTNLTAEKQRIRKSIMSYIGSFEHDKLFSKEGVRQKNGSILRVVKEYKKENISDEYELTKNQIRTLQVCMALKLEGHNVILVTNNTCLQIRAAELQIKAEYFRDETFPRPEDQYTGRITIEVTKELLDKFYAEKGVGVEEIVEPEIEFVQNEFVILQHTELTCDGPKVKKGYGKVDHGFIVKIKERVNSYGVVPENEGQKLLLSALYADEPLVIVKGAAGTGKTFLSMAVALELLDKGEYKKILVTRKTDYSSFGYLPGDLNEKMDPYIACFKDSLSNIINLGKKSNQSDTYNNGKKRSMKPNECEDTPYNQTEEDGSYYFELQKIKVTALELLRGRTINDMVFIIDEAQNIEPSFIKTIATRAGFRSKFIFLGDPTQIDNSALNSRYNGLVYLSEKMKGSDLCVQLTLDESESVRSDLAREAARLL